MATVRNTLEVHCYDFEDFRLIPDERMLLRAGKPVALPPKVFDTLLVLVENSGHLVEKDDLLNQVWPDVVVEEATMARAISSLRKVFGSSEKNKFIETVSKRGYRFNVPVRRLTKDSSLFPPTLPPSETPAVPIGVESASSPPTIARKRLIPGRLIVVALLTISVLVASFLFARKWLAKPRKEVASIAVLPFNQIGEVERDETAEFGMADTLITRLSNLKRIIVRPTSAVFRYAGKKPDPILVGRELKVDAVLEGTIQRSGERVRVTARLISTDDGSSLWAEHFDTGLTDIFALQDSISDHVVRALTIELSDKERELMSRRSTENSQAYRLYITGRHFFNKRGSVESLKKSIGYYEQAIAIDPNYARAYAGLADCYQLLGEYLATTPKEGFSKAREAATRALELDNQLAEAHTSLGYILAFYDWDFAGAERAFKRALELDPNYPTAHQWYGEFLLAMGRFEEARREHERTLQIDPTSLVFHVELAAYYFVTRQFDKAITEAQTVIEMEPNYAFGYVFLSFAYGQKGLKQEGAEAYVKSVELFGEVKEAEELRKVLAEGGIDAMWVRRIEQIDSPARRESFSAQWRSLVHLRLGEKERALDWLEESHRRRDRWMTNIKHSPEMDSLRDEPRFLALVQRMGL